MLSRKPYKEMTYEEKKRRMKERARQWFLENVENGTQSERRLAALREYLEFETNREAQ